MSTATVSRVGNSRAVFIPASIVDEAFAVGSKVEVEYAGEGTLIIRSADDGWRTRAPAGRRGGPARPPVGGRLSFRGPRADRTPLCIGSCSIPTS